MAYDEVLALRIRDLLDGEPGVTSKKMFGGLGFMVEGHMAVAAASSGALMVRADPADCATWTDGRTVNAMEMRGRPMAGWLLVDSAAVAGDDQLGQWVDRGVRFVRTLPPKPSSP
ncbi:RNA methyltransferase [Nocardioides sp. S5]|nr:RNA methyltransferase [Nocardioides sp. S5]